jgi:hypothetical protein
MNCDCRVTPTAVRFNGGSLVGQVRMDSRIKSANDDFLLKQTVASFPGHDTAIQ